MKTYIISETITQENKPARLANCVTIPKIISVYQCLWFIQASLNLVFFVPDLVLPRLMKMHY